MEPRLNLVGSSAILALLPDSPVALDANTEPGAILLPIQHRLSNAGALLSDAASGAPVDIALNFLSEHARELALPSGELADYEISAQYTDERSGVTHLYLQQTVAGVAVMNANLSLSLTARGQVIHVASSFIGDAHPAAVRVETDLISAAQAYLTLGNYLARDLQPAPVITGVDDHSPDLKTLLSAAGSEPGIRGQLTYVPTRAGLELAWRFDVRTTDGAHWYDAIVNATTGEPLYLHDQIEHASYNVFPRPIVSPLEGSRSIVTDPPEAVASPFGWHDTNGVLGAEFTDTRGNNASVQEDANADNSGGFRPSGGASLNFNFPFDPAQDPALYQSAAITNAFYWVNVLHDIHYQYGFTEAAGNFQVNNYGRGGIGNDPVLVDVQDGDGGSDGFVAFPDGQSPRMSLYRRTNPYRDRAYDSDILIHEFGHGISERLTGGPGNTSALNAVQSRGMGEGWGDWWALMLEQVATDGKLDPYPLGNYAAGLPANGPGIRRFPYSFDLSIDPLTLNSFNGGAVNNEQHRAGEIWCSALWDMNWLLIDKLGFSSDLYHGTGGNNLALQLVMDGLKLQGTSPSYLAGRDAILAADVALTGGQNQAEIWTAFARRGMGFSASDGGSASATTVAEAFDVPGTIRGRVFRDDDASGVQNGAEPGLAGWTVYRDLNDNGVIDVPIVATFNSTDTPRSIPDGPNMLSTRAVSGLSGVITDINVTVNLTHPYDGELYLTLISPANTPVILANYLGGSGDNYTNTIFDDEAPTYISAGSPPFTGSFRPYYNLSQLDGRDPNGTWKLRLDDAVSGNTGTLLNWSLQISYGSPDPVAVTNAAGDYTFFGISNATHHIREVVQPGFTQTAPAGGVHNVTIVAGQPASGRDFGNRAAAQAANMATLEDTLSAAIPISPPAGAGVTHYRVSGITGGTLFKNNGFATISNGDFLALADGLAGVKFLPAPNSNSTGHFDVGISTDGATIIAGSSQVTVFVAVSPVNDPPGFVRGADQSIAINAGPQTVSNWATALAVGPANESAQSLMFNVTNNSNAALFSSQPMISPSGTLTFTSAVGAFGTATVTLVAQDNGGVASGGLDTSPPQSFVITVNPPPTFQVTTWAPTTTGFVINFSRDLAVNMLNLYDIQGGVLGPADVTLVGATGGNIRGSVVVDPGLRRLTFVRTGGLLPPDDYTLMLRSASDGLQDPSAELLDGEADGVAGGNFSRAFTIAPTPAGTVIVSLPDFARGPQQPVNLPANSVSGLPVSLSDGNGITSATLQISYNPALLSITSVTVGAGLPAGAAALLDNSTPGLALIQFSSPIPLSAGVVRLVDLHATVPLTAPYRSLHVLDIANVVLNGGSIAALADDAVHVAAYFGDANGNGTYSSQDAARISRLAVGLDSGLQLFPLLDPVIIADITGNGAISSADAARCLQVAVGLVTGEVPPLP